MDLIQKIYSDQVKIEETEGNGLKINLDETSWIELYRLSDVIDEDMFEQLWNLRPKNCGMMVLIKDIVKCTEEII